MIRAGEKIGHIRIEERVGAGGMGAVFVGFDEKLQRRVALKAIRSDRLDAVNRRRFLAEARVLSQLDHPNVCRIHDYLEGEEQDILVLELIRGRTLRKALAEGLDSHDRLRIAEQVARALAAAHEKGVVHRDLKVDNVMLTEAMEAKVLDFGLARFEDGDGADSSASAEETPAPAAGPAMDAAPEDLATWVPSLFLHTKQGVALGTPSAMSPEQARGEPVTAASDVYSLGLLLQELFTGRPPYEPDLTRPLVLVKATEGDSLPPAGVKDPDLAALLRRLKALAPAARPTAAEAAERLAWIRGKPGRRLALQERALGPDHPSVAYTLMNVGLLLSERRDLAGAEPLYRRAIAIWERRLGPDHQLVVQALGNLAGLRRQRGDRAGAQALYQRALDATRKRLATDPGNPGERQRLAQTLVEIGKLQRDEGQTARAEESWREAVTLMAPLAGPAETVDFLDTHARALLYLGRNEEARPLVQKLLARGWNDAEFLALCRKRGLCPR